jgi:hypothetical protein
VSASMSEALLTAFADLNCNLLTTTDVLTLETMAKAHVNVVLGRNNHLPDTSLLVDTHSNRNGQRVHTDENRAHQSCPELRPQSATYHWTNIGITVQKQRNRDGAVQSGHAPLARLRATPIHGRWRSIRPLVSRRLWVPAYSVEWRDVA